MNCIISIMEKEVLGVLNASTTTEHHLINSSFSIDSAFKWHLYCQLVDRLASVHSMYIITFIIIFNYENDHLIKILSSLIVKFSLTSKPGTTPSEVYKLLS